jgi:peptidoglycan/xylan/chitin deacetylase (PgdA/CDA1 family)
MPLVRIIENNFLSIPILMYHSICVDREKEIHPYFHINTTPEVFEKHMCYLHENKYQIINLNKALSLMNSKKINKEKYVVITFDDGYRDFFTEAYPILKKYEFNATVFIATGHIGKLLNNKSCLSWDEIRFLNKNNIEFGSHTISHPKLISLDLKKIEFEFKESKNTIEEGLGNEVFSFSYPYAFPQQDKIFVKKLNKILTKCNYKIGVTTKIGTASKEDNPLFLKRIPVNSSDDILLFKAKLYGAYNWLNNFQNLYKNVKNITDKKGD